MMLGSEDHTPYDLPLIVLLMVLGVLLLVGGFGGKTWPTVVANLARRGIILLAAVSTVAVLCVTPTRNGIDGAARMLFLWPAVAFAAIAYAFWAWRAARF